MQITEKDGGSHAEQNHFPELTEGSKFGEAAVAQSCTAELSTGGGYAGKDLLKSAYV